MIRPESVAVAETVPDRSPTTAAIAGRATNIAFMGNHTRITVQTDAGTLVSIRFHESDTRAVEEEMVDREVHVWWDPRESTVVAIGDEPSAIEEPGGGIAE
jgi:ABC-type Fe3+/spermidine/putrescine transport system ATPase subunit